MATSNSIPGQLVINHEVGDTLKRTITLKIDGTAIDLTGCTIEMLIKATEYGETIETLAIGTGIVASNLPGGEFEIFWQSSELLPKKTYWYRITVTFLDGTIKTYLEDKLTTV